MKEFKLTKEMKEELEKAKRGYVPKYRRWSVDEEETILLYYGKVETSILARMLERTQNSIRVKAERLFAEVK